MTNVASRNTEVNPVCTNPLAMALVAVLTLTASTASAQTLPTFRWQFAPFCNVVTVLVEPKGDLYALTGTDDGCNGAAAAATANGSAHVNPGGSIGMSLTMVRPDGFVVTAVVELDPANLSGIWKDNWSNSGTLVFDPPTAVSGSPRPLTFRGNWSVIFVATEANQQGSYSITFPQALPTAPGAHPLNVIPSGSAPTANCPGSVAQPRAAPGQVCLYETARSNATIVRMFSATSSGALHKSDTTGVNVLTTSAAEGNVYSFGTWAVTVP